MFTLAGGLIQWLPAAQTFSKQPYQKLKHSEQVDEL